MDIGLLEKEVATNGLNATSKKYKLKKNKIKKLLGNNKKNIIEKNITKNNILNKDIIKESLTDDTKKNITSCNIDIDKLKILVENTDDILKIVEKEKIKEIKINNNRTTVTTIRINDQVYGLVKEYSKKNNETITNIINCALIQYLESH